MADCVIILFYFFANKSNALMELIVFTESEVTLWKLKFL
jgi:hypothetical protein